MTRRLLLALLTALTVLALPAAAGATEIGLNVNGGAGGGTPENFGQLGDTGARWARHFVVYSGQDTIDGGYDAIVEREQAMGVKTLFVVTGVGGQRADNATYARFVGRLAERYRGRVDAYEVWNEQDEASFWGAAPDAGAYVGLLRAAHGAIKGADPAAKVVFGPTTGNNYEFLQAAYAAGAKGNFDAVGVHTDTACSVVGPSSFYRDGGKIARFTFLGYRSVREVMLAHGDDKPIWMTEFGWSASQRRCDRGAGAGNKQAGVSEAQQAEFLREAYHCLKEDPYVEVAMWFNSRDLHGDGSELDSYGLKRHDGSDRPAAAAFRDVVAGRDTVTGGCGDFSGPQVRILGPAPGRRFGAGEPLLLRATSPDRDVLRMTFAVQGAPSEIRNFTNGGQPLDFARAAPTLNWQGAKRLPFGRHTIEVTALDAGGNVGRATVVVEKVDPRRVKPASVGFRGLKVAGSGRVRTLRGSLQSSLRFSIGGKVRVEWQMRRGRTWKKVHGAAANANKPFAFRQRLRGKGQWRVRVHYSGKRPFKRSSSRFVRFRVR